MSLQSQIFDVIANENARYKRNELECILMHTVNVEICAWGNFRIFCDIAIFVTISRAKIKPI